MNTICKFLVIAIPIGILIGCATATKYETLRGIPSQDFSNKPKTGKFVEVHLYDHPYIKINETNIYFATIRLSEDVLSTGPIQLNFRKRVVYSSYTQSWRANFYSLPICKHEDQTRTALSTGGV